ncbi:MAG: J domain-containing protein, partial [Spirochaetaceae bacterium]|nr:J domain-containing protein [Spirochaetaceae bacterium]
MTRGQALARLGLGGEASADEIKRSYRKLAFDSHPDLHPDNPNAGKEFQLLSEAYVFLTSSPPEGGGRARGQSRAREAEATEKARADARKAYERAGKRFQEERKPGSAKRETTGGGNGRSGKGAEKNREMKREEVLRDLLRDPFARRVFEDIYTQIR